MFMVLINVRRPAKIPATSSIKLPTFPGNRGYGEIVTRLPNRLLLNPSRLLQNLMRTLMFLTTTNKKVN